MQFFHVLEEVSPISTLYNIAFRLENWRASARHNLALATKNVCVSEVWVSDVWASDILVSDFSAQRKLCAAQCTFANNFVVFSPISMQFFPLQEDVSPISTLHHTAFCYENWRASARLNLALPTKNVCVSDVWVSDVSAQRKLCSAQCTFANNFVVFSPISTQISFRNENWRASARLYPTQSARGYQLSVTGYRVPVTVYRVPVTGYRLPGTGYRLPFT
jgi:hypothetical protein